MTRLAERVARIERRDVRAEGLESSGKRRFLAFVLTYLLIVVFMVVNGLSRSYTNAAIPAIAFVLSTLILGWSKNYFTA